MANTNTTVKRWNSGGLLKFGSDTVLNTQEGSLEFTPPRRAAIPFSDRGVQQTPLDGDEQLGEWKVSLKCGHGDATSLMATYNANPSATANATTFTVVIDVLDYRGATTGKRMTLTNCFLTKAISWKEGTQWDTLEIQGNCLSATHWTAF